MMLSKDDINIELMKNKFGSFVLQKTLGVAKSDRYPPPPILLTIDNYSLLCYHPSTVTYPNCTLPIFVRNGKTIWIPFH